MSDWIDFDHWKDCARMERPGFIFEVKNADGQSLMTPCTVSLTLPFDWKSAPTHFRMIVEPQPRHSGPIPQPQRP